MILPKKIKVLGKDYTIKYCDLRKETEAAHNTRGYICTPELLIRIDNKISARETLKQIKDKLVDIIFCTVEI